MFYTAEEVERLLGQLDPSQAIILDYTSDTMSRFNFTNWGVMGKFPWIFGMFSAYQPDNEIRGFYEHTSERLKLAKADPMCKGMVFWPELSHGDTFAIEYFARNAWDSDTLSLDESIERYCNDRYSPEKRDAMLEIWREFMPIVQMRSWSPTDSQTMFWGQNTFPWMIERATFDENPCPYYKENFYPYYGRDPEIAQQNKKSAMKVLSALMDITPDDDMLRRDVCDIARTVISRYLDCAIRLAEVRYLRKDKSFVDVMDGARSLMISLWTALCSHEDFSLLETLKGLKEVTETSENFEKTLKHNAEGYYCRSFISENVSHLYLPEMDIIFDEVKLAFEREGEIDRERIKNRIAENIKRYHETPLSEMQLTEKPDISKAIKDAFETIAIIDFAE
jgi:hypothetical protein